MSEHEPLEAAPVVSESGVWGAIPNPFDEFGPGAGLRDLAHRAGSVLLLVVLTGWLAAFSLSQATSQEVALPALERAVVALTEVDGLLDLHAEELQDQAAAGPRIELPGYPLAVSVPSVAVTDSAGELDRVLLRDELVRRSALLLQAQGLEAFRDPNGVFASPSRFSSAGLMDQIIDGLAIDDHDRWSSFVSPLGYASLLLVAAVLLLGVGFGRLIRLGVAMLIAAALVIVPALLIRLTVGFVGDDDVIGDEARSIVRTLAGTPIRNALWLAAGGGAIAIPALALDHLFEGSERRAAADSAPRAE